MSMYALMAQGLMRINRKVFGTPIPTEFKQDANGNMVAVEGGATTDPGVEDLKQEIMAGLSNTEPIDLQGALQFNQSAGKPAIQIFVGDGGDQIMQFVNYQTNQIINFNNDGSIDRVENAFNGLDSTSVTTNNTNVNYSNNQQPYITDLQPPRTVVLVDPNGTNGGGGGTSGYTGTVTVVTAWSVTISGCSVTISPSTSKTLTFVNGLLQGVA